MIKARYFSVVLVGLLCLLGNVGAVSAASGTTALINVSVANMYENANASSPVISQAIYASPVEVLQKYHGFVRVETADNYQGWVNKQELAFRSFPVNAQTARVKNLFAAIYQDASISNHQPILIVPFATKLPLVRIDKEWVAVQLADGRTGWLQTADVTLAPKKLLSMEEMLAISHIFVGVPYIWGGVSSYGFDCSGFVQMLYRLMGVFLPRDTSVQVYMPGFKEIAKEDVQPGDILYFGFDGKVSHTGIYLGDNKFINATTFGSPIVQISDLRSPHWQKIYIVARRLDKTPPPPFQGSASEIPLKVRQQMQQYSWHAGCPVPIENLAYLKLSYWGFDNKPHQGTMIVHKGVATEVIDIFKELYEHKYPIERMQPIDNYQGNDNASMVANNTSAFNCRPMTDFPNQYSIHSYGRAIDVNPLINPYVNGNKVDPKEGAPYADRSVYRRGKIISGSIAHDIFTQHGWSWGGAWYGPIKDYQHFEKPQ